MIKNNEFVKAECTNVPSYSGLLLTVIQVSWTCLGIYSFISFNCCGLITVLDILSEFSIGQCYSRENLFFSFSSPYIISQIILTLYDLSVLVSLDNIET